MERIENRFRWDPPNPNDFAASCEQKMAETTNLLNQSHWLTQATAGWGMGVARLFASIPISLADWGVQVARESPKGLWRTIAKFIEIPVRGFFEGADSVFSKVKGWSSGSLKGQENFEIAHEVTLTLGSAFLLFFGVRAITKFKGPPSSSFAFSPEPVSPAVTPARGAVDFSPATKTVGLLFRKSSVTDAKLARILEKHGGNQTRAAEELGVTSSAVCTRIRHATPTKDPLLMPYQKPRGGRKKGEKVLAAPQDKTGQVSWASVTAPRKRPRRPIQPPANRQAMIEQAATRYWERIDATLFEGLRSGKNLKQIADLTRQSEQALRARIENAPAGSPLAQLKGKI